MMSLSFLTIVSAALALGAPSALPAAQALQSRTDSGHRSVFSVELTYDDGAKARETMADMSYGGTEFVFIGNDPHGGDHQVWLDTIADLDVLQPSQVRLTLKNGRTMDLTHAGGFAIHTATPEGGSAEVRSEKIRHIRFLHPVRRDGLGNAIFDQWPFSPFTGKRVP